jgi:regulator of replication initiation timing
MFDKIKNRLTTLESDLAAVRAELAELKRTLSRVLGENHGLRQEIGRLMNLGLSAGYPRVRRHDWPDSSVPTPE